MIPPAQPRHRTTTHRPRPAIATRWLAALAVLVMVVVAGWFAVPSPPSSVSQDVGEATAVSVAVTPAPTVGAVDRWFQIVAGHSHGPPPTRTVGEDTYYILAGTTPILVHNCDQHVALGLDSAGLEDFARRQGAETLMNDRDWRGTVWTAANLLKFDNPGIRISFHLDGMAGAKDSVMSAVMQSLSRNSRQVGGATDIEMSFFHDAGTLGSVDFFIGGVKQLNPFA